jgi:hypothetical protein
VAQQFGLVISTPEAFLGEKGYPHGISPMFGEIFKGVVLVLGTCVMMAVSKWQSRTYYNLQRSLDALAKTALVEDRASLLAQVTL